MSATATSITTSTSRDGADKAQFLARWDDVNKVVFAVVKKYGGSISAEHGVGVMKRDILPDYKDPVALDLMREHQEDARPERDFQSGQGVVTALTA